MHINPEEISSIIRKQIENFDVELKMDEVGTVLEVGDGIARIHGLQNAMAAEMVEFENGSFGLAMNLEEDSVGVVIMGDYLQIEEGQTVKRTGRVLSVPAGEALIGRVVNTLAQPIDGLGPVETSDFMPIEGRAPGIADRQPVFEPLQTGVKAVDGMIPIGRGQRELIIGDRETGKTAVAVDTIINQKGGDVVCVYVAIGLKASTVAGVVETLRKHGAMDYTIVVCATANDPAAMQYMAPFAGAAMAEFFMYKQNRHTLCIYDDLSKQAAAYRQLSLLLRRPPGREAYPGDIFYNHSRLLERAAKLNDDLGGGSLTALPIIETQAGDVSAYIPTNVISITDGQIYLEPDLFYAGVRPAINVGISVSRVGGNAQTKAMKKVAGRLRLDLAQFRELEAFAQFASDLDASTKNQLARGERTVEVLKQGICATLPMEEQVAVLFAVGEGFMDEVDVGKVREYEGQLLEWLRTKPSEAMSVVKETGKLEDETADQLRAEIGEFNKIHWVKKDQAGAEGSAAPGDAGAGLNGIAMADQPKDIRKRIKSVTSTKKITKTMEMVAGAKLRVAQKRVQSSGPYLDELRTLMRDIGASGVDVNRWPQFDVRTGKRTLMLVMTANRGLCGGFTVNLLRLGIKTYDAMVAEGRDLKLYLAGRKGVSMASFQGYEPDRAFADELKDSPQPEDASFFLKVLLEPFLAGEVDEVLVVYPKWITATKQVPTLLKFLPIAPEGDEAGRRPSIPPIFEPSPEAILDRLLPLYLRQTVYSILLETVAAEQFARRMAMKLATDNAEEMVTTLTRDYNKARQALITKELAEILGGAEALN